VGLYDTNRTKNGVLFEGRSGLTGIFAMEDRAQNSYQLIREGDESVDVRQGRNAPGPKVGLDEGRRGGPAIEISGCAFFVDLEPSSCQGRREEVGVSELCLDEVRDPAQRRTQGTGVTGGLWA